MPGRRPSTTRPQWEPGSAHLFLSGTGGSLFHPLPTCVSASISIYELPPNPSHPPRIAPVRLLTAAVLVMDNAVRYSPSFRLLKAL